MKRWWVCVGMYVCVLGVGALVRVRQQRVRHLSRNPSQSSLTNTERAGLRGGRGVTWTEEERKEEKLYEKGHHYKDLKKKDRNANIFCLQWHNLDIERGEDIFLGNCLQKDSTASQPNHFYPWCLSSLSACFLCCLCMWEHCCLQTHLQPAYSHRAGTV